MNYNYFLNKIRNLTEKDLPGEEAQFKMVPSIRPSLNWEEIALTKPRKAAVLFLFYPDKNNNANFVVIRRKKYDGAHSGQISFPGGKLEENESLQQAALRETYEEVGVDIENINLITQMTNVWVAPSKSLVTPYIAYCKTMPQFTKDDYEVEDIIEIRVSELLAESVVQQTKVSTSYAKDLSVPAFVINNNIIWGATAMIINELRDLMIKKRFAHCN